MYCLKKYALVTVSWGIWPGPLLCRKALPQNAHKVHIFGNVLHWSTHWWCFQQYVFNVHWNIHFFYKSRARVAGNSHRQDGEKKTHLCGWKNASPTLLAIYGKFPMLLYHSRQEEMPRSCAERPKAQEIWYARTWKWGRTLPLAKNMAAPTVWNGSEGAYACTDLMWKVWACSNDVIYAKKGWGKGHVTENKCSDWLVGHKIPEKTNTFSRAQCTGVPMQNAQGTNNWVWFWRW